MNYGYIRVSSKAQHLDRQKNAIVSFNVAKENIFLDIQSGGDFLRPGYQKMLKKLKSGDTLIIKSIDRLGRNYEEIINQWKIITKEIQADIVVIDMPLLDTRRDRDITGCLISDIVLQLLSYVAHVEREFIKQRQMEGIKAAKNRCVKFGRPEIIKPDNFDEIYELWVRKEISAREAGRRLYVDYKTFLKWAKKK